jgi:hypothetical protein
MCPCKKCPQGITEQRHRFLLLRVILAKDYEMSSEFLIGHRRIVIFTAVKA